MKTLSVAPLALSTNDLETIGQALDCEVRHKIDVVNWGGYPTEAKVSFAIGATSTELCLKYWVEEPNILAEKSETNQGVCQDSCVEIFISPGPGVYFNCEFNCIGTALMGRGSARENSKLLPVQSVESIRRWSSLGSEPFGERLGNFSWSLIAAIPFSLLGMDVSQGLGGKTLRANFYKCGDHLSSPHYLTWNEVGTPNPDFHQPDFFGKITFI